MDLKPNVIQSFFPDLDQVVIKDVISNYDNQNAIIRQLLELNPHLHWIQAIQKSSQKKPLMILLRGLPGSGKSTMAKVLKLSCEDKDHVASLSADDFFVDSQGNYVYLPNLLDKAHSWCQNKARNAMKDPQTRILVIDNTNLQGWEMIPYCKMARVNNFDVLLMEPTTTWKSNPFELSKKSTHGVPMSKIKHMKSNMDANLSLESLCSRLPAEFKPNCLELETLLSKATSEQNVVDPPKSSTEDFQSLLQCFPDRSLDSIYLTYMRHNGNMASTVNAILDQNDPQDSDNNDEEMDLVLDADFAANLERSFGSVRQGFNFPGALKCKLPKSLAHLLHFYWKKELETKLTQDKIQELMKPKVEIVSSQEVSSSILPGYSSGSSDCSDEHNYISKSYSSKDLANLKEKRSEMFQKAAEAFKSKQGGVAAYYSEEGRELSKKIERVEEDLRYEEFQKVNAKCKSNSIDLHNLTLSEAKERLEWFLEDKKERLIFSGKDKMKLEVITGRGTKSKPKIKPSVISYLQKNGYNFSEINAGSLQVILKPL